MASKSGEPSLSNYYSGLDNTAKERYMDKLRLINKIDPYCRMESRSKKSLGSVGIYGTYDISIWGRVLINYVTSVIKLNGLAGYSQLTNYLALLHS